jgi:two-component system response regulator AtoC
MDTIHLLVVSREPAVLRLLWSIAESNGWHLETAESGWDAMELVQSGAAPGLTLLDLPRGDSDSLHLLRWLRRTRPDLSVAVLCHPDDPARGDEASRLGAADVLVGPFNQQQIELMIRRHLAPEGNGHRDIARENFEPLGPDGFFVSASPVMRKLRAQAELLAQADVPVLILGEAGCGKYTVANLIHKLSVRSGFRLLRVSCAETPESLLEAELFGDDSPSSGGARRTGLGRFAAGEKGTIFLDEITEMPARLQSRLLQVLQGQGLQSQSLQNNGSQNPRSLPRYGAVRNEDLRNQGFQSHELRKPELQKHGLQTYELSRTPVAEAVPADVRILAASSASIDRALGGKQLREDLYYRLSAFTVQVPPLRERKDEIAILLRYLMHKLAKHYNLPPRAFSSSILHACQQYAWPGNLVEMETFVKRYLVAGDRELTLSETVNSGYTGGHDQGGGDRATAWYESGRDEAVREAETEDEREFERQEAEPESLKSLIQGIKSEAEQNAIGAALKKTGWNRKAAARLLRVSYRTLLYKIDQYHMRAPESFLSPLPVDEFSVQANGGKGSGKAS